MLFRPTPLDFTLTVIHSSHASAACGILLLDAAQSLLKGNDGDVSEDLRISQECIGMLNDRSALSRMAEEMLNDYGSLHQRLVTLIRRSTEATHAVTDKGLPVTSGYLSSVTSEPPQAEPDQEYTTAITDAIRQAIDLVGNPFRYERKFEFEDIRDG